MFYRSFYVCFPLDFRFLKISPEQIITVSCAGTWMSPTCSVPVLRKFEKPSWVQVLCLVEGFVLVAREDIGALYHDIYPHRSSRVFVSGCRRKPCLA